MYIESNLLCLVCKIKKSWGILSTPTVQVFEALLQRVSHLAARTTTTTTVTPWWLVKLHRGAADGPELRWHVPSARPWCKWRPAPFFKWRCRSKNGRHFFVKSYPILNICLKPLRWYWFSDSIMFLLYFALVVQATLMTHFFLCQKTPLSQSFYNLHGPRTKVPNLVTL